VVSRARRALLVLASLLVLTACEGATVTPVEKTDDQPVPAARSTPGGVETWDLTVEPSAEAFGLEPGKDARIFQTAEVRPARFRLEDDLVLDLPARFVDVTDFGVDSGTGSWKLGVATYSLDRDALLDLTRSVLDQLPVDATRATTALAEFDRASAAASADEPERVTMQPVEARTTRHTLTIVPTWTARSGRGRLDVGIVWHDQPDR
jgi:hypothetical protein